MSGHEQAKGLDLHRPSRELIINNTGATLASGTWVNLEAKSDSLDRILVTAAASATEKNVGLVQYAIEDDATGTVLTQGRLEINTSSFSVGDKLSLASSTTYQESTDAEHEIAEVIVSASDGVIIVDSQRIAQSTTSGGATTLGGLNDVTISSVAAGNVIVSDSSGNWTNQAPADAESLDDLTDVTIDSVNLAEDDILINNSSDQFENKKLTGTSKEVSIAVTANAVTLSTQLGPVSTTDPADGQVLEYDAANGEYVPVDVPTGIATTFEELDDVNIPTLKESQVPISVAASASINLETTINTTEIFGVKTTDGLLFTTPSGSDNINELLFLIGRDTSNANAYEIVDNELRIEINFSAATTSFSEIYAACEASIDDIAFPDGERTVSGIVVHRNGDWTLPTNPSYVSPIKASGSIGFSLSVGGGETDTGSFTWSIDNRQGGNIAGSTLSISNFEGSTEDEKIQAVIDQVVALLNAITRFSDEYIASRSNNSLVITAENTGTQDNARFTFFIGENGGLAPITPSGNFSPNNGEIFVTGGRDESGTPTLLKWTDDHFHVIAEPTALFSARVSFKQGGFSWEQIDYELADLTDVNNGSDSGTQRQMLRKNSGSSTWNYVNARIENLNVDGVASHPGALVQGTVLQYAPSGNGTWEYAGLQDDGSGDFNTTPSNGQVMTYDFQGGINPVWTAKDPGYGTAFIELGDISNSSGGLYPMTETKVDESFFTLTSGNRVSILENGVYEIDYAYDFNITVDSDGAVTEHYIDQLRKNNAATPTFAAPGSVIPVNDWAHGQNLGGELETDDSFSITAGVGNSHRINKSVGPLLIDLDAGDFITLTHYWLDGSGDVLTGVIGLSFANNLGRKPWLRIKRVG